MTETIYPVEERSTLYGTELRNRNRLDWLYWAKENVEKTPFTVNEIDSLIKMMNSTDSDNIELAIELLKQKVKEE